MISGTAGVSVAVSPGVVWINGQRMYIAGYGPASQGNNADGYYDADLATGTVVLTTASNNGASPALAPNRIRLGIVVSSGGSVTVINQGSPAATGPTISSVILSVTDTLGNLIYPSSPTQTLIGYKQITTDFSVASASYSAVTGLSVPIIVPLGRRVSVSVWTKSLVTSGTTSTAALMNVTDGV